MKIILVKTSGEFKGLDEAESRIKLRPKLIEVFVQNNADLTQS